MQVVSEDDVYLVPLRARPDKATPNALRTVQNTLQLAQRGLRENALLGFLESNFGSTLAARN